MQLRIAFSAVADLTSTTWDGGLDDDVLGLQGFYVNHAPDGANRSPRASAMSLNSICRAAKLPTLANRQLRGARGR